jgi:hypothetical protein
MPFFSGSTDIDTLIDLLADQLIATGAWATADATLVTGQHPARRALVHTADNFYVYLARQVTTAANNAGSFLEILVQVSTSWSLGTHAPGGTTQTTGIPCEGFNGNGLLASYNKLGSHWTWIDASGFTCLSTWASTGNNDSTVLLTVERNATKEYADGYTNFFIAALANANPSTGAGNNAGLYYRNLQQNGAWDFFRGIILRPFNFTEYSADTNALEKFFPAYRSPGNSKVYFEFPFFSNNQLPAQRSPIAQTPRFFWVQPPGGGLADGDLVTYVSGPNTYTYLVKLLQSPDSTNYAPWAIRQA